MHTIFHVISHAFVDSIKIIPFLFIVYFFVEYFEHKKNNKAYHALMKSNRLGPVIGALFGSIPQCGFSVVASSLYAKRSITLGTTMAVFIATSDEAIPILLSNPKMYSELIKLLIIKIIIAVLAAFLIDILIKPKEKKQCCDIPHEHTHSSCVSCNKGILKGTLIHCVKIFLLIFVVTVIIDFIVELVGRNVISDFLAANTSLQPFIAAAVGIIPNCAASVILTQMYLISGMSFSALIGGLCTSAGLGLIVLFKENKSFKENLMILGILYAIGVISAFVLQILFI